MCVFKWQQMHGIFLATVPLITISKWIMGKLSATIGYCVKLFVVVYSRLSLFKNFLSLPVRKQDRDSLCMEHHGGQNDRMSSQKQTCESIDEL